MHDTIGGTSTHTICTNLPIDALCAEDVVPRLLASPKQSPEQVAAATIAALDTAETRKFGDDQVEDIMGIFKGIYDGHDYEQQDPQPPKSGVRISWELNIWLCCSYCTYKPASWLHVLTLCPSCLLAIVCADL